jgi:hypothetical protein
MIGQSRDTKLKGRGHIGLQKLYVTIFVQCIRILNVGLNGTQYNDSTHERI